MGNLARQTPTKIKSICTHLIYEFIRLDRFSILFLWQFSTTLPQTFKNIYLVFKFLDHLSECATFSFLTTNFYTENMLYLYYLQYMPDISKTVLIIFFFFLAIQNIVWWPCMLYWHNNPHSTYIMHLYTVSMPCRWWNMWSVLVEEACIRLAENTLLTWGIKP